MNRRLYRSRTDSVLGGVAGGVAEYLDVDPSIVRIVWAILAIVTGGIFLVLYIVMWIVVPEGTPGPYMPGPGAQPGWTPPSGGPPVPPPVAPVVGAPPAEVEAVAAPAEGEAAAPADAAVAAAPVPPAAVPPAEPGDVPPAPAAWTPPTHEHRHRRRGNAGLIFGIILVALGIWFLIDEYVPAFRSDLFWPIGLVVLGVILLVVSMRRPTDR
jgi:phage shock protein C